MGMLLLVCPSVKAAVFLKKIKGAQCFEPVKKQLTSVKKIRISRSPN